MFWALAAVIAALAVALLLWPLIVAPRRGESAETRAFAIYRDQLKEIARDRELGLIGEEEAQQARREVERRLLQLDKDQQTAATADRGRRLPAIVAVAAAPALAVALYLALGSPGVPDRPFTARQDGGMPGPGNPALETAVAQLAARLEAEPNDTRGWLLLGRSLAALERIPEAIEAYRKAIALGEDSAEAHAALGELQVVAADGAVGPEARQAFAAALERDPGEPRANFYAGLALAQDGRIEDALGVWSDLLASAPPEASWRPLVESQVALARAALARAGKDGGESAPSAPAPEDLSAASEMTPEQRDAFIRSMVEGLARRLESEGGSLAEWLRLANAYAVLGEKEDGAAALAEAEKRAEGLPENAPERAELARIKARLAALP